MSFKRFIGTASLCLLFAACQTNSNEMLDLADNTKKGPKLNCSAPPPVQDIWKLEPILIDKGLITENMSREQREAAIREYIRNKNAKYENCSKGVR